MLVLTQIWVKYGQTQMFGLKKMSFKMLTQLQLSIVFFQLHFLTQHLGLSIFDPNLG